MKNGDDGLPLLKDFFDPVHKRRLFPLKILYLILFLNGRLQ